MRKILATLALGAALTGGLVNAEAAQADSGPTAQLPFWMTRPCAYEDSNNCFWDAGESGNGGGHSFAVRTVHNGPTCVMYAARGYARKHDRCFEQTSRVGARLMGDLDGDGGGAEAR